MRMLKNSKISYLVSLIISAAVIASVFLTGCTDINGKLASKREVNKKVHETVTSEKCQFVSVEHFTNETPKRDVYTYETDRGLTFETVSTLRPFGIDGATIGYNQSISVNYESAVHELYIDRITDILGDILDDRNRIYYSDFNEFEKIADLISRADDVYKEELAVNSSEWLKKNPVLNIRLYFKGDKYNVNSNDTFIVGININGTHDFDELYDYITYKHIDANRNGSIEDESIPADIVNSTHVERLGKITYCGNSVSYAAYEDARDNRLINNTGFDVGGDVYSSYYYFPWDTYIVILNVGLTDETYAPRLIEAYAKEMNYEYKIQYKKGKVAWQTDNANWVILSEYGDNRHVSDFKVYKDKEYQDIPYITSDSELSPIHCSYLVGISVDDFANMFNVNYEIDEEEKELRFNPNFVLE